MNMNESNKSRSETNQSRESSVNQFEEELSDHSDSEYSLNEYDMSARPCGKCLIFNNHFKEFENSEREGTDKDKDKLEHVFKWLNFETEVCTDYHYQKTIDKLDEESKDKSKLDHNCFVLCFLSHGNDGKVCSNDAQQFPWKQLIEPFCKCEYLKGKPKIFIIQACQGCLYNKGVQRDDDFDNVAMEDEEIIADGADCYVFMATTPGNKSFRNPCNGSWFIQKLCDVLMNCADKHSLLEMQAIINNKVSNEASFGLVKEKQGIVERFRCAMSCGRKNTLVQTLKFQPKTKKCSNV